MVFRIIFKLPGECWMCPKEGDVRGCDTKRVSPWHERVWLRCDRQQALRLADNQSQARRLHPTPQRYIRTKPQQLQGDTYLNFCSSWILNRPVKIEATGWKIGYKVIWLSSFYHVVNDSRRLLRLVFLFTYPPNFTKCELVIWHQLLQVTRISVPGS